MPSLQKTFIVSCCFHAKNPVKIWKKKDLKGPTSCESFTELFLESFLKDKVKVLLLGKVELESHNPIVEVGEKLLKERLHIANF